MMIKIILAFIISILCSCSSLEHKSEELGIVTRLTNDGLRFALIPLGSGRCFLDAEVWYSVENGPKERRLRSEDSPYRLYSNSPKEKLSQGDFIKHVTYELRYKNYDRGKFGARSFLAATLINLKKWKGKTVKIKIKAYYIKIPLGETIDDEIFEVKIKIFNLNIKVPMKIIEKQEEPEEDVELF